MKGKDFFQKLGSTLGMSAEQLSKVSGNDSLNSLEISDEVANIFTSVRVFTEESAKANPEIRAAIRAEDLNGMDAIRNTLIDKYGLPDEIKNSIRGEKKTSNWMNNLVDEVAKLEAAKAQSSGKAKTELEKEIEKLNAQILQAKGEYEGKIKDLESARMNDKIDWELRSIYSNFDYAMGEVEKPIAINAAMAVVNQKLNEKGVKFKLTESGLTPFISKDAQELPYFDNNQKISTHDLIKKTLLDNKLLRVNQEKPKESGNQFNNNRSNQGSEKKINGIENLKSELKEYMVRDGFGG